jgi:mannan endo-1,4-beta-mannosidase
MVTRRDLLKSTVAGAAIGTGLVASTSSAMAVRASFGDGVNLQPSYYCSGDQNLGWGLMNKYPDIQTVRIEIEPDEQASIGDAKRWISEANANGYEVIATYHNYEDIGSGDPQALYDAAQWWRNNHNTLAEAGSFTVNLMNEWGSHDVTASEYASAYNSAISTVRQVYGGVDYH